MALGKRKNMAVVNNEGGEKNAPAAARRKGSKGAAMGGSFGDVLQKALAAKGSKGPAVGSGAKDSGELKKRIKKDKEAREEKMILAEKRKWFQKEHVVPVRRPPVTRADRRCVPPAAASGWRSTGVGCTQPDAGEVLWREQLHEPRAMISVSGRVFFWQEAADMNHEKLLLKLATKGVVKLFNVIQQQQKMRMEEKGKADAAPKPDKMTKSQFLNMLKSGGKVAEAEAEETEELAAPRRGKAAEEDAESDGMEEREEEEE